MIRLSAVPDTAQAGNAQAGAFDELQGAKKWTASFGYPYNHSGFLGDAADVVFWALSHR